MAALRFAIPVGLPPTGTSAVTHFEQLRTRLQSEVLPTNRVAAWVADEALYSGVHAMTRGLLLYVPTGATDFLGRTATEPMLVMRIWANEYLKLRDLAGRAAPKFVVYRHAQESDVRSALQAVIAGQPRLAAQAATVLAQVMAGTSRLLVTSGTRIGRGAIDSGSADPARVLMRRIDVGFENDLGDSLEVTEALDLWRLSGDELVAGHPLLDKVGGCRPSVAPLEGRTMHKLVLASALPPGPFQVLVDEVAAIEQLAGAGGTTVYFRVPPHTAGYVDVSVLDSAGGRANFAGALRYSGDYDTVFRAMGESFVVGLDCVEDVLSSAAAGVELVAQLERIADLEGRTWRELLAQRATATSSAPWTPELQRFSDQLALSTAAQVTRVTGLLKMTGTPVAPSGIPVRAFDGSTFFADIRPLMDANRGMYIAQEAGVGVYVCVDATFHRFGVLDRPLSQTMSEAMASLSTTDPMVRAIASGPYFAPTKLDYIFTRPSPGDPKRSQPLGQYVVGGTQHEEVAHPIGAVGQTVGRGEQAFVVSRSQPGVVTTPAGLRDAFSAEVLMSGGIERPGLAGDKSTATRVIYGVHRRSNTIFFFATSAVTRFASIAARLKTLGVDDAAQLDGGSSVMLSVGGTLQVDETVLQYYKDFSMPLAGYFRLDEQLGFDGDATVATSTDPAWPRLTNVHGLTGSIRVRTSGGLELVVDDFGSASVGGVVIDVATGLTATLGSPTMLLKTAQPLADPVPGRASALLRYESDGSNRGRLSGQIDVPTAGGRLVLDVQLPIVSP